MVIIKSLTALAQPVLAACISRLGGGRTAGIDALRFCSSVWCFSWTWPPPRCPFTPRAASCGADHARARRAQLGTPSRVRTDGRPVGLPHRALLPRSTMPVQMTPPAPSVHCLGPGRSWPKALGTMLSLAMVSAYIVVAYWFIAPTSFANLAWVLGRMLSDTFAGISPGSALGFVGAQVPGAVIGWALASAFSPSSTPSSHALP